MATMPPTTAPATMKSVVVNNGAGVLALSALALGGNAGWATTAGASAAPSAMEVMSLLIVRRVADCMVTSRKNMEYAARVDVSTSPLSTACPHRHRESSASQGRKAEP